MSYPNGAARSKRTLRGCLFVATVAGTAGFWIGCFLPPTDGVVASGTKTIVEPPSITILQPSTNLTLSKGAKFTISWIDTDPGNDAIISIFLDPDVGTNSSNGNEIMIIAGRQAAPDGPANDSVEVDTTLANIPVGTYQILALIQDSIGNAVFDVGPGTVQVLPEGVAPTVPAPTVRVVEPGENIGVAHNDKVCIIWEVGTNGKTATLTLSLDYDQDPYNDSDPNNPNPSILLTSRAVSGPPDPNSLDPNTIDPNALDPNACIGLDRFQFTVDTSGRIPARPDGLPYFIQAKLDDGINPPVYAYAPGWVIVQKWAAGVADLREAGEGLAAAVFQGFHGKPNPLDANQVGGWAGSWAARVGDYDGDGYDDFVVAARYGNPRGRGNIGQAYMIFGRKARFSSLNSLNSVGTTFRGAQFHAPKNWASDPWYGNEGEGGNGGLASVSSVPDLDFDGRPELLFGLPDVYTYDYFDDDPLDEDGTMYIDDFRHPYSDADPKNDDYGFDRMSLVVYVSSKQDFSFNNVVPDVFGRGSTIDLGLVGQHDPDGVSDDEFIGRASALLPKGVRFRGDHPYVLGACLLYTSPSPRDS